MVKNHLKRLAVPRAWPTKRKNIPFITRAKAGKSIEMSIPLLVALRDMIGVAQNGREVRALLHDKLVSVDGKVRKSPRYAVGLFDVVSLKNSNTSYRLVINNHGKLTFIDAGKEKELSVLRIIGKSQYKGKIQLNLFNGRNVLLDKNAYTVGDSIVLDKDYKVKEALPLQVGATVILTSGKHGGAVGKVESIEGKVLTFKQGDTTIETKKSYAYVIGKDKPVIALE